MRRHSFHLLPPRGGRKKVDADARARTRVRQEAKDEIPQHHVLLPRAHLLIMPHEGLQSNDTRAERISLFQENDFKLKKKMLSSNTKKTSSGNLKKVTKLVCTFTYYRLNPLRKSLGGNAVMQTEQNSGRSSLTASLPHICHYIHSKTHSNGLVKDSLLKHNV